MCFLKPTKFREFKSVFIFTKVKYYFKSTLNHLPSFHLFTFSSRKLREISIKREMQDVFSVVVVSDIYIFFFFFFLSFCLFRATPATYSRGRIGAIAYATAIATPDPNLHHSSRCCQILDLLSDARD